VRTKLAHALGARRRRRRLASKRGAVGCLNGLCLKHARELQWRRANFKQGVLRIFELCAKIGEHETCRGKLGLQLSYWDFDLDHYGF